MEIGAFPNGLSLRSGVTAGTNSVEGYHALTKWLQFGTEGVIQENDPDEQQKRIRYLGLLASALIYWNVVEISRAIGELVSQGYPVNKADLAHLSPYLTPPYQTLRRLHDSYRTCPRSHSPRVIAHGQEPRPGRSTGTALCGGGIAHVETQNGVWSRRMRRHLEILQNSYDTRRLLDTQSVSCVSYVPFCTNLCAIPGSPPAGRHGFESWRRPATKKRRKESSS
jgi:hypothetical protein